MELLPIPEIIISNTSLMTAAQINAFIPIFNETHPTMKFLPADSLWTFISPDYFPQTKELILALEKEQINFANPVRFIAIPVNFANTHWTVAIIDRERCTIRYFDSAGAEESL